MGGPARREIAKAHFRRSCAQNCGGAGHNRSFALSLRRREADREIRRMPEMRTFSDREAVGAPATACTISRRTADAGRPLDKRIGRAGMSAMTAIAPEHVPGELIWDHDFAAYLEELDDPHIAGARLHDGPDIIWATNASYGMPSWIFTRHALIEEGFADGEKFSNLRGTVLQAVLDPDWLMLPVESDGSLHEQYRRILWPVFTPAAMARRNDEVRALCHRLIDGFIDKGRCEFISEFASIVPNAIVVSLMGMPAEMLDQFLEWEETSMRGENNAARMAAGVAIHDYLRDFIAEQQRPGATRSELMEAILSGRMGDRALNADEIMGTVYGLFVAGLDTVFAMTGWAMRHLARDPALQTRLRNHPQEIPAAVAELTRAFGVSSPMRIVAQDMVFHGVPMKKGDNVMLPTFLAGRDPRAFPNPHVIDIDRKARHVTFGIGTHLCLGINLARRELAIMIESLLSRLDGIHMPADEVFSYHATSTVGVDRMVLAWDRGQ
jgi:cytochrome P450